MKSCLLYTSDAVYKRQEDACVVARFLINDEGEWTFEAMGNGYNGGLQTLVDMYTEE